VKAGEGEVTTRQVFEKALAGVQSDILRMGALAERMVHDAVAALMNQDAGLAAQVIAGDEQVDQFFRRIEDQCIALIATQHPVARDLRVVITGIEILINLERMSDYAVDIAQATMCISGSCLTGKAVAQIPRMGELAQRMLKEGLDAYVQGDADKARAMCALDDQVDYIFDYVHGQLTAAMQEDPGFINAGVQLAHVIRYLERIADHATNVGEAVVYLITGERRELN